MPNQPHGEVSIVKACKEFDEVILNDIEVKCTYLH